MRLVRKSIVGLTVYYYNSTGRRSLIDLAEEICDRLVEHGLKANISISHFLTSTVSVRVCYTYVHVVDIVLYSDTVTVSYYLHRFRNISQLSHVKHVVHNVLTSINFKVKEVLVHILYSARFT